MTAPHVVGFRICRKCGKTKPITGFPANSKGCRERMCTACRHRATAENNPLLAAEREKRRTQAVRRKRAADRAWALLGDAKRSDRRRKREGFDLTRATVAELLAEGCRYCGDHKTMMTLDRIDNDLAHSLSNVVPACIRCNYLRRDMPYEAWLVIAPSVRAAREAGLFGDWATLPFHLQRQAKSACSVVVTRSVRDGETAGAIPATRTVETIDIQLKLTGV